MEKEDIRLQLNEYLDSDEHLLWIGKPKQGLIFNKVDIFLIPFSFIWAGFPIHWGLLTMFLGDSLFEALFSSPFIIGGFYMTVGRFLFDILRRRKIIYAITENRMIIKNYKNIISLNIKSLTNILLEEKTNNRGNIILEDSYDKWNNTDFISGVATGIKHKYKPSALFEGIEDAKKVYKKIIELREKENDF